MTNDLEEKIIGLISAQLGIPEEEVTLSSSFRKDFEAENLAIADLIIKIQEEFNLDLEDVEPDKVKTVGQLINLITDRNPELEK